MNPGNMNTKLGRKLRAMAVWYVLLAGLEDVETQRRGFCFVVNPKTVKISQVKTQPACERNLILPLSLERGTKQRDLSFDANTKILTVFEHLSVP